MDRQESAAVLKDVVIYRSRSDVPADVVEAIDVAMQIFAREPRMEREKEARLTRIEGAVRRMVDAAIVQGPTEAPSVWVRAEEFYAVANLVPEITEAG